MIVAARRALAAIASSMLRRQEALIDDLDNRAAARADRTWRGDCRTRPSYSTIPAAMRFIAADRSDIVLAGNVAAVMAATTPARPAQATSRCGKYGMGWGSAPALLRACSLVGHRRGSVRTGDVSTALS